MFEVFAVFFGISLQAHNLVMSAHGIVTAIMKTVDATKMAFVFVHWDTSMMAVLA